jgi:hypothetical protein
MTDNDFDRYKKVGSVAVEFAQSSRVIQTLEGNVRCSSGDAILTGVNGERWPVSRIRFVEMYEPAGDFAHGCDGQYRKKSSAYTLAKRMDAPFTVRVGEGDILTGKAGDWLTQYADGQQGIVADDIFRKTYQRI